MTIQEAPPAAPAQPPARIPAVVFSVMEWLIFGVLLALAWQAWRGWPMVPLADPDTWGYLNPGLTWLSGLGFQQTDGRDWLYPALVALFLKSTGSFAGIVAWQKLFSFLAAIAMMVTWQGWVSMLPFRRGILFLVSAFGALPMYMQLVNQQNIFFAVSIRPEAILPFFVYAQLACVMGYSKYRWHTPQPSRSLLLGAAAIALAYAGLLLKPSWYFATITTSLPVFAGLFSRSFSWKTRLLTPAFGGLACFLILWLPGRILMVPDGASVTLLPDALLCVHARFVDNLLEARLATLADADPGKARLKTFVGVLESEMYNAAHAHKVYEKLGFNADYLMHSATLSGAIMDYTGDDRKKFSAFCFRCYKDAVLYDPAGYTRKVFDQFNHFLYPEPKTFFSDQMNLAKEYRASADSWFPNGAVVLSPGVLKMYGEYRADLATQEATAKTLDKDLKLRTARQIIARCSPLLELVFLIALLITIFWSPLRKLALGGWAAFFLFLAPLGNAFGVCIVHTLDIYRYRVTYGSYFLFALAAMLAFIGLVLAQSVVSIWAKSRAHPAP